jgi:hypothetical protein
MRDELPFQVVPSPTQDPPEGIALAIDLAAFVVIQAWTSSLPELPLDVAQLAQHFAYSRFVRLGIVGMVAL